MSVLPRPTPTVPETRPVTAPTPAVPERKRRRWPWLVVVAASVLVVAWLGYQLWLRPKVPVPVAPAGPPTAKVFVGPLERTIRVTGITSSIRYVNIRAPEQRGGERQPQLLLELVPSGTRVKQGDVVARIDDQQLRDHIDDVQATIDTAWADVRKRKAEQEVELGTLQQNLLVLQSDLEKWKLEAKTAEVRTVIDQELLKIGIEEAEARVREAQEEIRIKKQAQEAELKVLEITARRHEQHRARHEHDLERYTVLAPMDGLAVRQPIFRGGQMQLVREGDQVFPGMLFLRIMDVDRMQLEAQVNQVDASLLRIGQPARVGLDAFPDLVLKGRVESIGSLAKEVGTQVQYVRTIPVKIRIEGKHPQLIPDLSGYADIVVTRKENVTQVPLAAVHQEQGETYVWVQQGQRYERRPVVLGMKNYTHAEVLSGLKEGETVLLGHPPKPASQPAS